MTTTPSPTPSPATPSPATPSPATPGPARTGSAHTGAPPDGGRLLRAALRLDAAASGVLGLGALAGAGPLAPLLGAPTGALRGTGAFLVVFALGLAVLAARRPVPRAGALVVVAGNAAWVVASAAVAITAPLTGLGTAVVLVQAGAVAVFAALQLAGVRRQAG